MLTIFFTISRSATYDVLFKNAVIVDGTGSRPRAGGFVGVNNDKIDFVGFDAKNLKGEREIDVAGLFLTPGFLDSHAHLDEVPMLEPNFTFQVTQGVTTIVTGPCGVSAAPTRMDPKSNHYTYLMLDRVEEWKKDPPTTFERYYKYLDEKKYAVNIAPMLGHSNIRDLIFGNVNISFNETTMSKAKEMIKEAMDAGAFGMTAGLMYTPSGFGDAKEIGEMCKVITPYGGIFMNHIRSESDRLVESVEETLEIGRIAKIPVQVHHMKSCGKRNENKSLQALRIMEEARMKGQDVTADQYPYIMSNTDVSTILPPWVREGDSNTVIGRLKNTTLRPKIKAEIMDREKITYDNLWIGVDDPDKIIITRGAPKQYMGKSLKACSGKETEEEILDWTLDFIADTLTFSPLANFYALNEKDFRNILPKEYVMIGSDSDVYYEGEDDIQHPRNMASHAVYLRRYVKDEHFLTLEQAVRKMSGLIAERFGISDKGFIKEGMSADINVFNLDEINDTTKETGKTVLSTGMKYVMNNGVFLIDDYKMTGNKPGRALRKTYYMSLNDRLSSLCIALITVSAFAGVLLIVVIVLSIKIYRKRRKFGENSVILAKLN
jgi:N-acyl-D-amino-acid deacylase